MRPAQKPSRSATDKHIQRTIISSIYVSICSFVALVFPTAVTSHVKPGIPVQRDHVLPHLQSIRYQLFLRYIFLPKDLPQLAAILAATGSSKTDGASAYSRSRHCCGHVEKRAALTQTFNTLKRRIISLLT